MALSEVKVLAFDVFATVVVDRGLIFISDGGREPDDTVR